MQIDSTTAADLHLFAPGGEGVFGLVDHTATAVGRAALRQRMRQPHTQAEQIRRTQAAVAFLMAQRRALAFNESDVASVLKYLHSNTEVSSASGVRGRVESAWVRLRYSDVHAEIADGVRVMSRLFDAVGAMCAELRRQGAPASLDEVLARMDDVAQTVRQACSTNDGVLAADRELRVAHRGHVDEGIRLLGELDALNAMARATTANGWTLPEIVDSDTFILEADHARHPLLPDGVRNTVRLSGAQPTVFLTGPNMAGKTTYLRTVALVALLAQMGMGAPAERVRLSPVEVLLTSLNPADNLKAGLSYFLAEVLRVKQAATVLAEGRRALIIFDEVFKGTNVRDALDASAEVILGFARARQSGIIFSSHLTELVEVLRPAPSIRFCCFDGDIVDGVPRYSYRLLDGVSDRRLGLLLLAQADVPGLIAQIDGRA